MKLLFVSYFLKKPDVFSNIVQIRDRPALPMIYSIQEEDCKITFS